jgi:poly [ADP-ribose] polymerase 2/3/4
MSTLVREERLIYTEVGENSNKGYVLKLYDDGKVTSEWGRVGEKMQMKDYGIQGTSFFDKTINGKLRKGYTYPPVLNNQPIPSASASHKPGKSNAELLNLAIAQISTNDSRVEKFIRVLVDENKHTIAEGLDKKSVQYDESKGTYTTPLGPITQSGIDSARLVLANIATGVRAKKFTDTTFERSVSDYMRIVPMDVGRKKLVAENIFPDDSAIQKQNDLLDALEASLQMIMAAPADEAEDGVVKDIPKLFAAKLHICNDQKVIDRLTKFYGKTRQSMHSSHRLNVKTVYEIDIEHMTKNFESKLDNIWELWHGTRVGNLLSIIKNGFMVPPSNASHCTGRMFGDGIYHSDQSTKALNYATGWWAGSRDPYAFMFLNEVAMGNIYYPRNAFSGNPPKQYDSTWAKAGESGVANNEMIARRATQIRPKYLIEFA